jgi:hypothetical protein
MEPLDLPSIDDIFGSIQSAFSSLGNITSSFVHGLVTIMALTDFFVLCLCIFIGLKIFNDYILSSIKWVIQNSQELPCCSCECANTGEFNGEFA